MSEYLPYGGFKWVKTTNETVNRILNKKHNSLHGYFLEVDLDYPEHLHEDHSGFPMAPEKIKTKEELLSPYCLEIKKEYNIKVGIVNKLIPNLMSKKNYVVHYRNLKYYLLNGLILKKVHKILDFKQRDWMKSYIDFNTQRRKEATNEANKTLFKLLNNAVYGKTMENMRKRIKIRIIKTQKDFLKYASRPTDISHNTFGKRLVVIHEKKEQLTLNKPIYVGNTVLELSKLAMYKFYYDFVKKKCKKCILLFTDTDSLCIETEEDFYEIMHEFKELFDLSNFPKNSKYFCNDNKKLPGKMKDEYGGIPIYEFIGLKSKMYSIRSKNNEKNILKGHNTYISNDEYHDVLQNKKNF